MNATSEFLSEALGGRYAIEREVGRGGMATVYLARDIRDGQQVAIKVMHRSLVSALGTERFRREMGIAVALDHPGIVPLWDSGDAAGVMYYVMPYVEGESLYHLLKQQGRLPIEQAVQITRDVADALGYAHSRGVLHRDVKPENILLAGGHALIADFGLARAIGAANYQKLTDTGMAVGTVYYISPEHFLGDRNLDQRADIYSLGSILFEMLAGEPPHDDKVLHNLIQRIVWGPVPSVRLLRGEVPPGLEQAINRALAKAPAERFASMEEFAAALGRSS
jgi:serine/threonine-protein kinase